jgi:translocation and assembly module TamB
VTDEGGTQAAGPDRPALALNGADGVWSFTQAWPARRRRGRRRGESLAPPRWPRWPNARHAGVGRAGAAVANLGVWGTWVPPGWRLAVRLQRQRQHRRHVRRAGVHRRACAAPRWRAQPAAGRERHRRRGGGQAAGRHRAHRALHAAPATARSISAAAPSFGAKPRQAAAGSRSASGCSAASTAARRQRQFRRCSSSADKLTLDGKFVVDEGLIDTTRSDAPGARRRRHRQPPPGPKAAEQRAQCQAGRRQRARRAPGTRWCDATSTSGQQLRVRGRGLDTGLRGELRITTPPGQAGRQRHRAAPPDGTYAAYGQKLEIDRGIVVFNGAGREPALDIWRCGRTWTCGWAWPSPATRGTRACGCTASPT